jgi:autotransporter-associated beta strand protein
MTTHKRSKNVHSTKYWLVFAAAFFTCFCVRAFIVGPYTTDTHTLHLWHLDESAVPAVDSANNGTNLDLTVLGYNATLGNASFPGFGSALNTGVSNASYLAASQIDLSTTANNVMMQYADPVTGAFTVEAVVRVDFDPAANVGNIQYSIVVTENDGSEPRMFYLRLLPIGSTGGGSTSQVRLQFFNLNGNGNLTLPVPTSGSDAIVQGKWYHVAATWDGAVATGGGAHLNLYWTLMDPSRALPTLLGTGTMNNLSPIAFGAPEFSIGNHGRGTPARANWPGLIDEVRISSIARAATNMMFYSFAVVISQDPVSQSLAVGQPANFSITAAGSPPLYYQWRTNSIAIPAATNSAYSILSARLSDAASYDVVVTNGSSAATSAVATLTVRVPLNLTWLGSAGLTWDTNTVNWDSNSDAVADSVFTFGDNVRFDDNGSANPIIDVSGTFTPSSVVVSNSNVNYFLGSSGSGGIAGSCGLTKQGSGSLTLDINNSYAGPTIIQEGTLTVGNSDALGSLGTGPITNLGVLDFNSTATFAITNILDGSGSLITDGAGSLRLMGANTFSGPIAQNKGNITVGPAGLGKCTNIVMTASGGAGGTSFTLEGGAVVGANVSFSGITSGGDSGNRVNLTTESGSNIWNGPITLAGDAPVVINVAAGSTLEVNGPISSPSFNNVVSFRGAAASNCVIRSQATLPTGGLQKDDGIIWTVRSTNNAYLFFRMLAGTLTLGNDNTLATNCFIKTDGGVLDLAGFNQSVAGLANYRATPVTTIANSSTNRDSRLTVITTPADLPWVSGCIIADATAGGTRKTSLTLTGGATLVLTNASTYSGDTTVTAGTLALSGAGAILNSSPINLASGTTLDASARTDGTLTVGAAQVLKGDGAVNVLGALTNNGTIELKLSKAGATLSNDSINGPTALTYGGTLKLDVPASPALTTSDSFKLFTTTGYNGTFASISPSVPVFGLAWDTSTLATDGTLRIKHGPALNPTNITAVVVGGSALQIAWPLDHLGWSLQVQTNAVGGGLSTNWFKVSGSDTVTQEVIPLSPANGSVFYRLVYP